MISLKNNHFKLFFFIITLLFTLRSYYFYSISLAPTPVIGAFFLFSLTFFYNTSLKRGELFLYSFLILIFSLSIVPTLFSNSPYLNSIFGLLINLIVLFSVLSLKDKIVKNFYVVNYVLLLHVAFFAIQFVAYYLLGEKVDFLEPITGEVQRMSGFERIADSGGLAIFRPSGLFSEPSSYCVFLITLLWVLKKSRRLIFVTEFLVLFSIISSFSISGIVFALAYLFLNYYKGINLKSFLLLLVFVSLLISLSYEYIISYFEYRILNLDSDNSTNERLLMFKLFSDLEPLTQLMGAGVGNDIIDIPLTTVPSLLVYLGVFGSSLFFIFLISSFSIYRVSFSSILFLTLITFNFYKISNPYVWFFLSLLFVVSINDEGTKSDS